MRLRKDKDKGETKEAISSFYRVASYSKYRKGKLSAVIRLRVKIFNAERVRREKVATMCTEKKKGKGSFAKRVRVYCNTKRHKKRSRLLSRQPKISPETENIHTSARKWWEDRKAPPRSERIKKGGKSCRSSW